MKNIIKQSSIFLVSLSLLACNSLVSSENDKDVVDYVNPYMGNISHMLVPTYPTVSLPNSMMRFYPDRDGYSSQLMSIPLIQTSHRGTFAFHISPLNGIGDDIKPVMSYTYDNEKLTPYHYEVYLDQVDTKFTFSPSEKSAIMEFEFEKENKEKVLLINTSNGELNVKDNTLTGYQIIGDSTKVYLYLESADKPIKSDYLKQNADKKNSIILNFDNSNVKLRYAISYISIEQAKETLYKEIPTYEAELLRKTARNAWLNALTQIEVEGDDRDDLEVFYTSLYRTYERMINISESGKYYSAFDGKVHEDNGVPFYTDDWAWDSYKAAHPLRLLIDPKTHYGVINSYIRMAEQSNPQWIPTFPEVYGDTHRMNGTHSISIFTDAAVKNFGNIDLSKAYEYSKNTLFEKSYLPWTKFDKKELSKFMDEKGYFPALRIGEKESYPYVTKWEKRQAVAVTLAASFDYWSLSKLAKLTGNTEDLDIIVQRSEIYKNLFNEKTKFFHPKDNKGNFIEPFDYELSGGLGGRDYYDENNGYTYRFDLQQNPMELVRLMGGQNELDKALDNIFQTKINGNRFVFYSQFPDHTGNVGQFSMANEPSMHIPYLYNYAAKPWKTQKTIHKLIREWFRSDLMGVPGDEDGGGLSAFVVFSMMGIYPVTPGLPIYNIGSPFFKKATIKLEGNRKFVISAPEASKENKYIQSAKLNGKEINRAWLLHSELIDGGELVLEMGNKANKNWGTEAFPTL